MEKTQTYDSLDTSALIEQCRHGESSGQIHAALTLAERRAREAVPVILPLLSSEDDMVRSAAVNALGTLGDESLDEVGPALVACLSDPDESVRNDAALAFCNLRYLPARPALEHMLLHDEDWVARASAADALGELGELQALGALEAALADEHYSVRTYALMAMEQLGGAQILPIFRKHLAAERHLHVRVYLITAILRLGDESVFDDLLALMHTVEAADEPITNVLGTIERYLSDNAPPIARARAVELGQALAELGRRVGQEDYARALIARLEAPASAREKQAIWRTLKRLWEDAKRAHDKSKMTRIRATQKAMGYVPRRPMREPG